MRYLQIRPLRLALAAAVLFAVPAVAQLPATPRALGMGGALMAASQGQEALFYNPAHLGFPGTPHWSAAVPQVVMGGTMAGLRFGDINDLINYRDRSREQKLEILGRVPRAGTRVEYDLNSPFAAFQMGRFAAGVQFHTAGSHGISYDLAELFLSGYEEGRRNYDVSATVGERMSYRDYSLAYGRRFGPLNLGVTGHLYRNGTLIASRLLDVETDLLATDYSATYFSVRSEGGTGYGLDVGAAVQPVRGLTLSVAMANAVGAMNWSESLQARSATLERRHIEGSGRDDLRYEFDRSGRPYTDHPDPAVRALADGIFERSELPQTLRMGASYNLLETGTLLATSYSSVRNDTRLAGLWSDRLSLGVEQRLSLVRLRAGFAADGDSGSLVSGGVSVGPTHFGLARLSDGQFNGADRAGWLFSFGLSTRSNSTIEWADW